MLGEGAGYGSLILSSSAIAIGWIIASLNAFPALAHVGAVKLDDLRLVVALVACLGLAAAALNVSVGGTLFSPNSATWVAAVATLANVVVACALLAVTARQADNAAAQTKLGETQAKLVAVQTEILDKQKEISRQAFIATYRPRISVRNVTVRKAAEPRRTLDEYFQSGETVRGQLYVVNKGGSEARITDGLITVSWSDTPFLPMERPYEGQDGNIGRFASLVFPGASIALPFSSDQAMQRDVGGRIMRGLEGWRLYVMGWLEYRDGSYDIRRDYHGTRRTAFCRVFDVATQRFKRVTDEDYEHEE